MSLARAFPMFFVLVLTFALAACSDRTPDSVVKDFYVAIEKGNVDEAAEQISFVNVPADQMGQANGKLQMIVGEMRGRIKNNKGLDDVEIVESNLSEDGKSSSIRVKLLFNNGKDTIETHRLVNGEDGWKILWQ